MVPTLCNDDHETTKGFSLLTSLRQHFAALRQQDAGVPAHQPQTTPDDPCTPCWVQPYDLQYNSQNISVLGSRALTLPDSQCMSEQPVKHTKEAIRSSKFLCNSKVRRRKQRQHHKWHQQQEKHQEHFLHNKHAVSHLPAEDTQSPQHFQPDPAHFSQAAVSCEAAAKSALGQALQVHLQNSYTFSVGHTSNINQQTLSQQLHNSTPCSPSPEAVVVETYITQASANDSHPGCIRAQPRWMWQNPLKPTDSIPDRRNLCLRLNQGRQSAHTFQIASDLRKAGQLRTQNLHAAVSASVQLMHRFVVRCSAIAHMGVFTTGYLAAGELVMEYAGEVIRRPVADRREQQYSQQGLGLYFFALDKDHYIDATYKGNIARYINHSCRPNCVAKLADVQGQHRVFIFAMQEIAPLEELTYDYKVSVSESQHDAGTKAQSIPCNCKSLLCRGSL